jgi:hypothetical protein
VGLFPCNVIHFPLLKTRTLMHLLTREKVWFCVLRSFRDPPRDLTLLSLKCRTLYCKVLWLLQFYSASFTEDLRQVVKHVGTSFPTSRLYAAGWSLGANILVRYLGQVSSQSFTDVVVESFRELIIWPQPGLHFLNRDSW